MFVPFLTIISISGVISGALNTPFQLSDITNLEKIANNLHKKIISGVPEFGIESTDPLLFDEIIADAPILQLKIYNGSFNGYKNCEISNLKLNEDITSLQCDMICQKLSLNCNYDMRGQLVRIYTEGRGYFESFTGKYLLQLNLDLNRTKGSDGKTHLAVKLNKFKGVPKEFVSMKFEPFARNDKCDELNKVAFERWLDTVKQLQEPIWPIFLNTFFNNFNTYFKHVALEDILSSTLLTTNALKGLLV